MWGIMSFKFMHAADIHLDSPLRGLERYSGAPVAEVRGASRRAFIHLVSECIAQPVAFLLLVGDLYDRDWKDYNTGLFLLQQMARLKAAGIPVYIVRGNHDAENVMTKSLRSLDNMHVFSATKPETFLLAAHHVALHGQSYGKAETGDDLSLNYPKPVPGAFNIGLLHTSADGSSSEHATYAPCSVQKLIERGYDYWALGHVHKRRELSVDPPIVFPGNLQGRHIRETGPKGATLVTVQNGRTTLEHRDFDVMRWFVQDVSVAEARSAEAAIDQVHDALAALRQAEGDKPLAVRVRLHGASEAHKDLLADIEHWTNEVRARGTEIADVWVEKVIFETRSPIDVAAMRLRATPLGELLRTLDADRHDPLALAELGKELTGLQEKFGNLDNFDPPAYSSAESVFAMLDDVEQLLIPLLLEGGDSA